LESIVLSSAFSSALPLVLLLLALLLLALLLLLLLLLLILLLLLLLVLCKLSNEPAVVAAVRCSKPAAHMQQRFT
jgi:hypothetical protein